MELQQDEIVKKKDQTHSKFLSSWIRNQQRKDFSLQKELKSSKKGFMAAIKQVKKSDDSITAIYQSSHVSELKVYYQNFKAWKQECIHRVTMAYYLYKIKDPEICCGLCNVALPPPPPRRTRAHTRAHRHKRPHAHTQAISVVHSILRRRTDIFA